MVWRLDPKLLGIPYRNEAYPLFDKLYKALDEYQLGQEDTQGQKENSMAEQDLSYFTEDDII
jgi:hypothetical protein